jgi:hypothetical protein
MGAAISKNAATSQEDRPGDFGILNCLDSGLRLG